MSSDRVAEKLEEIVERLRIGKPWLAVLLAEELGRELGEVIAEKVSKPLRRATNVAKYDAQRLTKVLEVAKASGAGRLREFCAEFAGKSVRISVNIDRRDVIPTHADLGELAQISPYLKYVDCFTTDANNYVVRVADLSFSRELEILVIPTAPTQMNRALATYDLAESG